MEGEVKPTQEQEDKAKKATDASQFNGGIQDPTKFVGSKGIFQDYVNKANEHSYTDEQGNKKSFNKGTKWQEYIDKSVTDPAAKQEIESQIRAVIAANPNMSDKELKYRLRAIEANLRRRYPNGVAKNFDISGSRFDRNMAKDLLKLGIKGEQKPSAVSETKTEPAKTEIPETKPAETSATKLAATKPAATVPKSKGNLSEQEQAAFARLKQAKGTDADLALFGKYSKEELAAIGFGPKSIEAILAAKKPAAATSNAASDDDTAFVKKYKEYTQQLSGAQPRSAAAVKQLQESEAHKFVTDPANKQRYQTLLKNESNSKQADKINKKIAKLEKERAAHEGVMKQYPNDPDIQRAQQSWVDSINKAIEKLKAKLNPKPAQN